MTDIDELEGRELDAAVAREVMGYRWEHYKSPATEYIINRLLPPSVERSGPDYEGRHEQADRTDLEHVARYSDDAAREWPAVADEMRAQGYEVYVGWCIDRPCWATVVERLNEPRPGPYDGTLTWHGAVWRAEADDVPKAVCYAALRAVAAEEGDDG